MDSSEKETPKVAPQVNDDEVTYTVTFLCDLHYKGVKRKKGEMIEAGPSVKRRLEASQKDRKDKLFEFKKN